LISKNTDSFTITIKNTQTDGGNKDVISITAPCSYRLSGGNAYIVYKEDNVSCMIKAGKDTVHVKRSGEFGSDISYKANSVCDVIYKTPYGNMQMRVFTSLVSFEFNENGGFVHLEYVLEAGEGKLYNNMEININR
jgi:uncharacterized beta-barrel protein YwiB (DUF1934 family)